MKRRWMKLSALTCSGGLLLQLAGCGTLLLDTVVQNVIGIFVGTILSAIVTGATQQAQ